MNIFLSLKLKKFCFLVSFFLIGFVIFGYWANTNTFKHKNDSNKHFQLATIQPTVNNDQKLSKTQLDQLNNQKLDTLWITFKETFKNYDGINDERQFWSLLLQNKDSATPGHSLQKPVKTQLQELVNTGYPIETIKAAIDLTNSLELDKFWKIFKDKLKNYSGFKSNSVIINSKTYTLTDLWAQSIDPSHPAGSTFTDETKTQLQTLANNKITWNQIKTELDKLNNEKLDTFWATFQKTFADYNDHIPSDPINVNNLPYFINLLLEHKNAPVVGHLLADEIKTQLQALVNTAVVPSSLVNTLNSFIRTNHLKTKWNDFKATLTSYSGLKLTTVFLTGKPNNNYNILALWEKLQNQPHDYVFTPQAQNQLQILFDDHVSAQEILIQLNTQNKQYLNIYWNIIQNELRHHPQKLFNIFYRKNWKIVKEFLNYLHNTKVQQITVWKTMTSNPSNLLTIHHLLRERNNNFTDLSTDAKTQLQNLLNAYITNGNLGQILIIYNSIALQKKWNQFKAQLSTVTHQQFKEIIIPEKSNNLYLLTALWAKLSQGAINGHTFSDDALNQLQALVNDNVSISNLRTIFNKKNQQLLYQKWTALKNSLQNYPYLQSNVIIIKGKTYILTDFWNKSIDFTFTSTARSQLQALVNNQITWEQIKTQLDLLNNQRLESFWNQFRLQLIKYADLVSGQITIANGDRTKVYDLKQLFQDREKTTVSALKKSKSQLQTLLNDGITVREIVTQLDNLNIQKAETKVVPVKNEKLKIGLGIAGGTIFITFLSGLGYCFVKIKAK